MSRRRRPTDVRALAAFAVQAVLQGGESLAHSLPRQQRQAIPEERGLLAELSYGCLRHASTLQWLCSRLMQKPLPAKAGDVTALLLVGLYQLRHTHIAPHAAVNLTVSAANALDKPWATRLINGVLRQYLRQQDTLDAALLSHESARFAHPPWLIDAIRHAWPTDAEQIFAANNTPGGMTLRVNAVQHTTQAYLDQLHQHGIAARPSGIAPHAVYLQRALPVEALPGFALGSCSVQDVAAQLCTPLLDAQPGHRVLDACAAPGGKTCHLLEHTPQLTHLLAIDNDATRLPRVHDNLARLALRATVLCADASQPADWYTPPFYDRILLDAPCSGTGVIRRHPDIKWLRRATDIPALATRQAALLRALWPLLAPGGTLLYTTCSILPAENEEVISAFLADTPTATALPINAPWGVLQTHGRQLFPCAAGDAGESHDGFYFARLHKPVHG